MSTGELPETTPPPRPPGPPESPAATSQTKANQNGPVAGYGSEPSSLGKTIFEFVRLAFLALLAAVVLETQVVQSYWIPSASMVPTLQLEDRVMVSRITYRVSEPQIGHVVVFDDPNSAQADRNRFETLVAEVQKVFGVLPDGRPEELIKRVVATGGQTVEAIEGVLYVDGVAQDEPHVAPGAVTNDFGPQEVPQGHIWVMGDNRGNSIDSRVYGPIAVEHVDGRAFYIIYPSERWTGL